MSSILIVDDEADIRDALKMVLENEGYDVKVASNGNEAIRYQQNAPADIVITDIIMPEKDGINTIKEISNDYPRTRIIAISGGGDPVGYKPDAISTSAYLAAAKKEGADLVITKPFERDDILQAVADLLRLH